MRRIPFLLNVSRGNTVQVGGPGLTGISTQ